LPIGNEEKEEETVLAQVPENAPMTTRKKLKDFCHECGGCCYTFILNVYPGEEIIDFLKLRCGPHFHGRDFDLAIDDKIRRIRIVLHIGCLYLTKDQKCSIYDKRPGVCRAFWCDNVMRRFLTHGQLYGIEKLDTDDLKVVPKRLLDEIPLVLPSLETSPASKEKASNT